MARTTRALEALGDTPHEVLECAPSRDNVGQHSAAQLRLDLDEVAKTLVVEGTDGSLALCCAALRSRFTPAEPQARRAGARLEARRAGHGLRRRGHLAVGHAPPPPSRIDAPLAALATLTVSAGQRGLSVRRAPPHSPS
ncbi:Cys-tRNA(Pro) deacylase [Corynebacterium timonense]|uniref:Cys-tRNA(Pro) deacylase n=1 Tax=Corynebacterium timonense TaxID=441500 RepID=UPI00030A3554|nr:Cys-tRNA(Pro) deacylase [Corynebacterium timonense]